MGYPVSLIRRPVIVSNYFGRGANTEVLVVVIFKEPSEMRQSLSDSRYNATDLSLLYSQKNLGTTNVSLSRKLTSTSFSIRRRSARADQRDVRIVEDVHIAAERKMARRLTRMRLWTIDITQISSDFIYCYLGYEAVYVLLSRYIAE